MLSLTKHLSWIYLTKDLLPSFKSLQHLFQTHKNQLHKSLLAGGGRGRGGLIPHQGPKSCKASITKNVQSNFKLFSPSRDQGTSSNSSHLTYSQESRHAKFLQQGKYSNNGFVTEHQALGSFCKSFFVIFEALKPSYATPLHSQLQFLTSVSCLIELKVPVHLVRFFKTLTQNIKDLSSVPIFRL